MRYVDDALDSSLDAEEEVDNDSYRSNDEWWKDPLAMFDDEDEHEDEEDDASTEVMFEDSMLMMPSELNDEFVDLVDEPLTEETVEEPPEPAFGTIEGN